VVKCGCSAVVCVHPVTAGTLIHENALPDTVIRSFTGTGTAALFAGPGRSWPSTIAGLDNTIHDLSSQSVRPAMHGFTDPLRCASGPNPISLCSGGNNTSACRFSSSFH
jgi:hypothetical protein